MRRVVLRIQAFPRASIGLEGNLDRPGRKALQLYFPCGVGHTATLASVTQDSGVARLLDTLVVVVLVLHDECLGLKGGQSIGQARQRRRLAPPTQELMRRPLDAEIGRAHV